MVEYLMIPTAALILLALLAVQFLAHDVRYGPRTRRALALLAVPAAAVAVLLAGAWQDRPWWSRLLLGALVGGLVYLGAATLLVLHWRSRKADQLVGDVRALRRRVAEQQRELDRLFWEAAGAPPTAGVDDPQDRPSRHEWLAVLRQWQRAVPTEVARRAAQLSEWRAEFARSGTAELRARARVLEAAWRDIPDEEQRQAVRARTAVLWLVHDELEGTDRGPRRSSAEVREQWDRAQQTLTELRGQLASLRQQRTELLQHRLPLD